LATIVLGIATSHGPLLSTTPDMWHLRAAENLEFKALLDERKRCYADKIVARAIESWQSDARVAVFASGGLSHFVVDEELDNWLLDGMKSNDEKALVNIPADRFRSGSSEMKNWIPVAGIMMNRCMTMNLVDYVPCYRSEAGTGNAMAFVYWQ
jgi:hypothetical protein